MPNICGNQQIQMMNGKTMTAKGTGLTVGKCGV